MSSAASQCDSGRHGGPSQSPVSFISSSAPSEGTQDSGLGMSTKVCITQMGPYLIFFYLSQ